MVARLHLMPRLTMVNFVRNSCILLYGVVMNEAQDLLCSFFFVQEGAVSASHSLRQSRNTHM